MNKTNATQRMRVQQANPMNIKHSIDEAFESVVDDCGNGLYGNVSGVIYRRKDLHEKASARSMAWNLRYGYRCDV